MHREQQQVDLLAVSEQTKIKLSLLEGLERDDVSHWPRGIFRRSYVRAYASAIGLDPEPVTREFLARYPDPEEDVTSVLEASLATGRPPMRLRFLVRTAITALSNLRQSAAAAPPPAADRMPGNRVHDVGVPAPAAEGEPDLEAGVGSDAEAWTRADIRLVEPGAADASMEEEATGHPEVPELVLVPSSAEPYAAHDHPREWTDPDDTLEGQDADAHRMSGAVALSSLATLCTRLGRAREFDDIQPVLEDAAGALDAVGLLLWVADEQQQELMPLLAGGYPRDLLVRLPSVPRDSDNALATAFRTAAVAVVPGGEGATGAVAMPVVTADGCSGVLAIELHEGAEQSETVLAFAAILAAQLATLLVPVQAAEAISA